MTQYAGHHSDGSSIQNHSAQPWFVLSPEGQQAEFTTAAAAIRFATAAAACR